MNVSESVSHEKAVELLPWLINDSLDEQEREAVLEHAHACVICRRELNNLKQLRDSIAHASNSSPIPGSDMRNINARIDALIDRQNLGRELLSRLREVFDSPWRIAFAAQTVVLLVLATVMLWHEPRITEFATLTQPNSLPGGHYVRVVFSPDLRQSRLISLLDEYDLMIVDGPSNRGVYTLGITSSNSGQDGGMLASSLQDDPSVLFAQPVIIGADR